MQSSNKKETTRGNTWPLQAKSARSVGHVHGQMRRFGRKLPGSQVPKPKVQLGKLQHKQAGFRASEIDSYIHFGVLQRNVATHHCSRAQGVLLQCCIKKVHVVVSFIILCSVSF